MNKPNTMLLAITTFALGCAATAVMPRMLPSANAQVANFRWEYFCMDDVDHPWQREDLAKLNAAGQAGWELVLQDQQKGDVYCFKRRAP